MNLLTVYHGSIAVVEAPCCMLGRDRLDFGKGFYVTDIRAQAEKWANSVKDLKKADSALLNIYTLDKETILKVARCKIFKAYDKEWLDFIVNNRSGVDAASAYDYIEGGVADDRVINSVNMYIAGYYDLDYTLRLLSLHQPNNQICIRKQELIEKYLRYERTENA